MNPNDAVARADGVAQAPDGSLYIADSQKGKIWRVIYFTAAESDHYRSHQTNVTPCRRPNFEDAPLGVR